MTDQLGKVNLETNSTAQSAASVHLLRFVGYFLRLGTVGFGGPIALAGYMQRDLVDERGWVSKQDYLEGLALAQLARSLWRLSSQSTSAMFALALWGRPQ